MQNSTVVTLEVPLTVPMYQYIEERQFKEAYKLAALGIPQKDWLAMANAAILGMEMEIARKALTKIKKIQFLRMLDLHEEKIKRGEEKVGVFLGEIYAHQGKFSEAAKLFKENGEEHRAVAMYADLRMFELAQEFLGSTDSNDGDKRRIMKMKAEWAVKINEPRAAAEMYLVAGEKLRAIQIMGDNQWTDMLLEVGRKLDITDKDALTQCADSLVKLGQVSSAAEMYKRLGVQEKVLEIYVTTKEWQEAFLIAEKFPHLKKIVYLPYAQWLAESDRFTESQKAFHEAGCPEEAFKVLDQLKSNAVTETRFHDAGYYHWILSRQYMDLAITQLEDEDSYTRHMSICKGHEKKAAMYYAYNSIFRYTDQPFTPFMPDALFNISRFLMHELMVETDIPISKFHVLYTLAKQARTLKAFKLARVVLERLKCVKVPRPLQDGLRLLMLASKGDPFDDNEELLPMCYRCSTTNPLLNPRGNNCINCCHPFIYSFVSFEVLPLVEFQLEEGITDEEALGLIGSGLPAGTGTESKSARGNRKAENRWKETTDDDVQVLQFDETEGIGYSSITSTSLNSGAADAFSSRSVTLQDGQVVFSPVIIARSGLRCLEPTEVVIMKRGQHFRHRFFKNLIPDMSISLCSSCLKLFHTDDYILQILQKGHCPFCRSPSDALERRHNLD